MSRNEREQFLERKAPKEQLSEEKLGDLLAAFGNHEGKALLLISMKPNRVYTKNALHALVDSLQQEKVWKMNKGVPSGWCANSLAPIGLVAKEVVDPEKGVYGYEKTAYGDIGTALAGHLLGFSEKYPEISLYTLLASTNAPSKRKGETKESEAEAQQGRLRAPLTRYRIFSELVKSEPPIRNVDLLYAIKGDHPDMYDEASLAAILTKNLPALANNGIITLKTTKQDRYYAFYAFSDNAPQTSPENYRYSPTLTQRVYGILKENPTESFSAVEIYDLVVQKDPDYETVEKKPFIRTITGILKHLQKEGYSTQGKFDFKNDAEITLTKRQKEIVQEFVGILDTFAQLDEEFLIDGQRKAQAILADPERFSHLLRKAKDASPSANKIDRRETANRLLDLIGRYPGSTIKDLRVFLKQEYDQDLTGEALRSIANMLEKTGQLAIVKNRQTFSYTLSEKEALPPSGVIFES